MSASRQTLFMAALGLAAHAAVAAAVFVTGSPEAARKDRLDKQRVYDLKSIARAIEYYHKDRSELPDSLDKLLGPNRNTDLRLADPETKAAYEYQATSATTYQLCANFLTAQDEKSGDEFKNNNWRHGPGRKCYTFTLHEKKRDEAKPMWGGPGN